MNILLIGDEYIQSNLFKKHLNSKLKSLFQKINYKTLDFGPNDYPQHEYKGISEYWGDIVPIMKEISDCEALVVVDAPISQEVIEKAKKLKVIGCSRGGPVNVDLVAANQRKIPVLNAPGRNTDAVADFTIGLILTLIRKVIQANNYLVEGKWTRDKQDTFEKPTGPELGQKIVGLVGFGEVGRKVAKRLSGFNVTILGYDPFVHKDVMKNFDVSKVSLLSLLKKSDIVSLHLRLPETKSGWFNYKKMKLMKRSSYLINTSRGYLINENDLTIILEKKLLAGVALDVYSEEPIDMVNQLITLDNVILTPHVAGTSYEIPERSAIIMAEQIAKFFKGEPPDYIVNPGVLQ